MDHETLREKLLLYKDPENSENDWEIARHLETCEECRAFRIRLEKIQSRLAAVSLQTSPAFVYKVMQRLEAGEAGAKKAAAVPEKPAFLKWFFPALGYTFAIVLMFVVITHREFPVTTESVLLSDIPQESQWGFSSQAPDAGNLLGS